MEMHDRQARPLTWEGSAAAFTGQNKRKKNNNNSNLILYLEEEGVYRNNFCLGK